MSNRARNKENQGKSKHTYKQTVPPFSLPFAPHWNNVPWLLGDVFSVVIRPGESLFYIRVWPRGGKQRRPVVERSSPLGFQRSRQGKPDPSWQLSLSISVYRHGLWHTPTSPPEYCRSEAHTISPLEVKYTMPRSQQTAHFAFHSLTLHFFDFAGNFYFRLHWL